MQLVHCKYIVLLYVCCLVLFVVMLREMKSEIERSLVHRLSVFVCDMCVHVRVCVRMCVCVYGVRACVCVQTFPVV